MDVAVARREPGGRVMTDAKRRSLRVVEILAPFAAIGLWWYFSSRSTSVYFPPLNEVIETFRENYLWDRMGTDVIPSLIHLVVGFSIAIVVGTVAGAALGLSPRARRNTNPVIEFFRSMPIAAMVPAALILLRPGARMEVGLIAFGCVWPILISTCDGARTVEPIMIDAARVYGLSRRQTIARVIIPAATPQVFAGIRIALPVGLALMLVGNMFGSSKGLGYLVVQAQQTFNIRDSWASIVLLGIIGCLASVLLGVCERRLLGWHRGWRAQMENS